MERIDQIGYFEFKLKMLEQRQHLLEEKIRNHWKDLRKSIRHPIENGVLLPSLLKSHTKGNWRAAALNAVISFLLEEN